MINSIFYFPTSESDYNTTRAQQGISSRTISFVPDSNGTTGKIYKNGILYGSSSNNAGSNQINTSAINSTIDSKIKDALSELNSSINQKINNAETRCNNTTDQKIANAISQLSIGGSQVDYTVYVYPTDTGVKITQPGASKTYQVTIPGVDNRINEIISSQNTITNRLSELDTLDGRLTTLEGIISRLNSCCSTTQSAIDTINNTIISLQNRISALETQASIQPSVPDELTLSEYSRTVSAESGTLQMPTVEFNGSAVNNITASNISILPANTSWISFTNNQLQYTENTSTSERYANVVITYGGLSRTYAITQSGASVQPVTNYQIEIANNGRIQEDYQEHLNRALPEITYGGTVVSNSANYLSNLPGWIAANSNTNTINISQNTTQYTRNATITFTYDSKTASIYVEQGYDNQVHTFALSSNSISIGAEARTIPLPKAYYDQEEVPVSQLNVQVSGTATYSGNGIIQIQKNDSGNESTSIVTVTYLGKTDTYTITQTDHILSFDAQRSVFTDTFTGTYDYSGYKSVILYYDGTPLYQGGNNAPNGTYDNVAITYSSSNSNLNDILNISQSPNSIALQFNTNESEDSRGGTLTFTYNGKSVTMTIEQEGADISITRFHETSGAWQYEFDIDGYGKQGGNDPHPYFMEQQLQRSITEDSAKLVTAQLIDSNNIVVATLGAGEEYSSDNDGTDKYIIERRWSSSEGLVIGIHLEKWQDAIDEYDNLSKVSGTIDGVYIEAVPMKSILTKADEMGPRTFRLVVSQNIPRKWNYSATWDVVQYCNYGIKLGRSINGQTALGSTGFGSGLYGQPGRFTPACDAITNGNTTTNYKSDYFCLAGKNVSLAISNGNGAIEKMCGNYISYPDYITSDQDKNIIIVKHFNGGPDVITSTYYGDFTDTNLSLTNMTLMTRHVKTGHTPATVTTGVTQFTNYSTIGDASLRYTTDSDWRDS